MKQKALQTTLVPVVQLVPDPENPRYHDKRNVQTIRASFEAHGQVEHLVVQKSSMRVIHGNARLRVLQDLKWDKANAIVLDVSDEEARALSIALNRSGELASWNEAVLVKHLQQLHQDESRFIASLGFNDLEVEALTAAFADVEIPNPDDEPELPPEADSSEDDPEAPAPGKVATVSIYLDAESLERFKAATRKLAASWDTDNITDTVFRAVLDLAGSLPDLDE